ncbi:MAG: divalent-cation tolerance protein CutA [Pseudomonadota bacterium]
MDQDAIEAGACCLIYSTWPNPQSAAAAAKILLEERLIACANVLPGMTSVFRWQGAVCEETEAVAVFKTTSAKARQLIERAGELHPYDTPALVAVPFADGHPKYLGWLVAET